MKRPEIPDEPAEQRLAVVIPCYNEASTILNVVNDFAKALPDAVIYVFDNNSTDGTGKIAEDAGATVIHSPHQGKGNVIRHMARTVDADIYVIVDGDATYPADAAPQMIRCFREEHLDMLVGTRFGRFESESFRVFHKFGNRIISKLISRLFSTQLEDVLSGYRVVSRSFVKMVSLRRGGFEVETEMTLQALTKKLAVKEIPIRYGSRAADSPSKLNTWGDGWLILKCITLLFKDYRPLLFFAGISFLFGAAALIIGLIPIQDFIQYQFVYHVPRAILAAGLAILSLISLTAGLILDTVVRLHEETVYFWKQQLGDK